MKTFFILYDLDNEQSDGYDAVNKNIEKHFKECKHIQGSVWKLILDDSYTLESVGKKLEKVFQLWRGQNEKYKNRYLTKTRGNERVYWGFRRKIGTWLIKRKV